MRDMLALSVGLFCLKAIAEMALWADSLLYASMSPRGWVANHMWYLTIAGLGQGSVFATLILLINPARRFWGRLFLGTTVGALVTLWGANVVHNFDVLGLCLNSGDLSPLTFAFPPQTILGALIGGGIVALYDPFNDSCKGNDDA